MKKLKTNWLLYRGSNLFALEMGIFTLNSKNYPVNIANCYLDVDYDKIKYYICIN